MASVPSTVALRPYQNDVIDRAGREIAGGRRRILLVAPTGSGKTVLGGEVSRRTVRKGRKVLFIAHRRELIKQTSQKLDDFGIDHGIIQAGFPTRSDAPVQVASISTLTARAIRGSAMELPDADVVIIDEAHHARAETYQKVIEAYPKAVILGLTATPCRADGRGLGNAFDCIVSCPSVADLINLGFLVPSRVYAPSQPDLSGVEVKRGDYVEQQLAVAMNKPELVGDVVTNWLRLGEDRQTIVFASGVAHSVDLRDAFSAQGIVAAHVDGTTPEGERDQILSDLRRGAIKVVTNAMVLTEGFDAPSVGCLVLARPTKSLGLFFQMVGRVLRPAEGKVDAIILDHSGAVFQHGLPDEPVEWTLREDKRANSPRQAARKAGEAPTLSACPECHAIRMSGGPCTVCGWRPVTRPRGVDFIDGDLAAVDKKRRAKGTVASEADQFHFYQQLCGYALERGFKPGWAAFKFKDKFGEMPKYRSPEPVSPAPSTRSWIRSRMIAAAKRRAAA